MKFPVLAKLTVFKGAILLIWINLLSGMSYDFQMSHLTIPTNLLYIYYSVMTTTPLFGWIADAWIGRYKVILYSIIAQTVSCVILNISLVLPYSSLIMYIQYTISVLNCVVLVAVQVTLLPFIVDQMMGGSGDELSSAVNWWMWSSYTSDVFFYLISPDIPTVIFIYTFSTAFSLASLILFKHWLAKETLINYPLKLIIRVIDYARKNKYPLNRSALTYWEEEFPSRVDLGKEKYGGPFSEEEVENVKTFIRLLPLIFVIALSGLYYIPETYINNHLLSVRSEAEYWYGLVQQTQFQIQITVVLGVPIFHFILSPILQKQFTRFTMLRQIIFGLLLQLTGSIGFLIIEVVGHTITPNATCMFQESPSAVPINIDSTWSNIPEFVNTLGVVIGTLGILKFIVAQSPLQMRGLLFGCYFGFAGVFRLSGINLYKCFINFPHIPPSCGFYFHLTNTLILIVIFILFIILSKLYKLRQRNNPVNVHLIVGDHVERYIAQREQFEESSQSYGTMEGD